MFIDTHCHINMMVKKQFDVLLTAYDVQQADSIIQQANMHKISTIINVGTSVIESKNCITLAQRYEMVWAAIGIHPNDCTAHWKDDVAQLHALLKQKAHNKIVAIGECGLD